MEEQNYKQTSTAHDCNDDDGLSASVSSRGIDSLDYYEWTYRRPLPFNAPAFCYPDWVHGLVGRKQTPMYDPVTYQLIKKEKTTPKEPNGLRRLWDEIHSVNGFPKTRTQPQELRDILLGKTGPPDGDQSVQWTQLLPYSEEDVVAMMIWMRENGAVDFDPVSANQAKAGVRNAMPTLKRTGDMFKYNLGGILMAPTKKTLWRLCLLALSNLYDYAVFPPEGEERSFKHFNLKDLTKGWTQSYPLGIELYAADLDDSSIMGREYCKLWGKRGYCKAKDFATERLEVVAIVDNEIIKKNIYEYHYVLVKPREALECFDVLPLADNVRQYLVWQASKSTEGLSKLPPTAARFITEFNLPPHDAKAGREMFQGGGPEIYVAFEPVAGVYMFWQTVRRLIREQGYVIEPGSYFQEVFDLADFYLRLCQITRPSQIYDIKFPDCFTDKLPSPRPSKLDDTLRKVQRNVGEEHWSIIKSWHKRMTDFKVSGDLHDLERARASINRYNLFNSGQKAMSEPLEEVPSCEHPLFGRADPARLHCVSGLWIGSHLPSIKRSCSNIFEYGHGAYIGHHKGIQRGHADVALIPKQRGVRPGTVGYKRVQPKRANGARFESSGSASPSSAPNSSSSRSATSHTTPSSAQVRKHVNSLVTLEELAEELTYHCVGKQVVFDGWVKEFGLSEALERLRMQLPNTSDREIPRLWSEIVRVRSTMMICNSTCFADLRGSEASGSEEEDDKLLEDFQISLDFQGLRSRVKDMKMMLEVSEDLRWESELVMKIWGLLACAPIHEERLRVQKCGATEEQAATNDRIISWRQSVDSAPVPAVAELEYPEPTKADKEKHAALHKEEATLTIVNVDKTEQCLREKKASRLHDLKADLIALRNYTTYCREIWMNPIVDRKELLYLIEKLESNLEEPLLEPIAPISSGLSDPDNRSTVESSRHTI